MRVLNNRETRKDECNYDRAHANGADSRLLQPSPKEEHHRGPKGRQEGNQPDVIKK
jgi:hypothetical protein